MIKFVVLLAFLVVSCYCQTPCTTNATYCQNRPSGECMWSDPSAWDFCNNSYPRNVEQDVLISIGTYVLTSNVTFSIGSMFVNPNIGVFFRAPFSVNRTFTALSGSVIEVDIPTGSPFYLGGATSMRNTSFTWNTGDLAATQGDQEIVLYGSCSFLIGMGIKTLYRSIQSNPESTVVFQDGSILTIDQAQIDASNIDLGGSVVIALKPNSTVRVIPTILTGDLHIDAPNKNVAIGVSLQADLLSVNSGGLILTDQFVFTQINVQLGATLTIKDGPGITSSYNVLTNNGYIDIEYGCGQEASSARAFPPGTLLNYGTAVVCAQFESGLITNNGSMILNDQFTMNVSVINNYGNVTVAGDAYFIDTSVTNYGFILGQGFVIMSGNGSQFDWNSGTIESSIDVTRMSIGGNVFFDGKDMIIRGESNIMFLNLSDISSVTIQPSGYVNLTGYIEGGNATRSIWNQGTLTGTGEIVGYLVNSGTLLDPDFDTQGLTLMNSSMIIYNVNSSTNQDWIAIDGGAASFAGYFIVNINVEIKSADDLMPFIVISNGTNTTGSMNTTLNINFDLGSSMECSYQVSKEYKLDGGCFSPSISSQYSSSSSSSTASGSHRNNGGAIAAGILVPLIVIACLAGGIYWYRRRGGVRAEYRKL